MAKKGDIYIDFSVISRGLGVMGRSIWKLTLLPFRLLEAILDHFTTLIGSMAGIIIFFAIIGLLGSIDSAESWPEFKETFLSFTAELILFVKEIIQTIKDNV